jgi:DNA-directed RNA polymerase subunit RPC12/RpoP
MVYSCKECDATFTIYSTYYSHKKTKHEQACIKCKHCDNKFKTIHARNSHYYNALAHKSDDIKQELQEALASPKHEDEKDVPTKTANSTIPTLNVIKLPSQFVPSTLSGPSESSASKLSYRLFDL